MTNWKSRAGDKYESPEVLRPPGFPLAHRSAHRLLLRVGTALLRRRLPLAGGRGPVFFSLRVAHAHHLAVRADANGDVAAGGLLVELVELRVLAVRRLDPLAVEILVDRLRDRRRQLALVHLLDLRQDSAGVADGDLLVLAVAALHVDEIETFLARHRVNGFDVRVF